MSVALLFAANLVSIAALTGLIHWLGHSVTARLESVEAARAVFLAEYPQARVGEIVLTAPRDGALLQLDGPAAIGVIAARGKHWLVRLIEPAGFGGVSVAGVGRVTLRLGDFTAPRLVFDLGDAERAALWCARLHSLRAGSVQAVAA
ncbi:MAG: hypothetical protein QOJ54_3047 [Aliidongia sp.]|jgi:hypothetical protein|nr:hypothetical protein [Aliidongia sp.]